MKTINKEIYKKINGEIKGYRIGHMDLYSVAVQHTPLENSSFYQCFFKEDINGDKLKLAVKEALNAFPLFKTKLAYYDEYYLEFNNLDSDKIIKNCSVEDRPKTFGSIETTNGYLFQITYLKNSFSFEWCHAVSDGRGALLFLSNILDFYFDVPVKNNFSDENLVLPFESVYDKNVKMFGQVKQENGFNYKALPVIKNGYKCKTTSLKISTSDVMKVAKKLDSTPVAILAPLFSKAIRDNLPKNLKNKNVSCGIVVDARKGLGIDTLHNCVLNKVITYTDKINTKDLETQATVYRGILDLFSQRDNLVAGATEMMNDADDLYRLKPVWLERLIMKIVAPIVKNTMNNIAFTYIGRVPFSDKVKEEMTNFKFRSWPDIGSCVCAMADLNGQLLLDITENYKNQNIVDTFVEILKNNNIFVEKEEPIIFEQANVRV